MFGLDMNTLVGMAKPALEKDGLKSVVIRITEVSKETPDGVQILKYTKDIIEHLQTVSNKIKLLESEKDISDNLINVSIDLIKEIKAICNSRKSDANKLKSITNLLAE